MIKLKSIIETIEPDSINKITDTINSPEFKNWFSNSKVVDKRGNPLVVYHGGTVTDKFDDKFIQSQSGMNDHGFSFSTNENVSQVYAKHTSGFSNAYFLRIPKLATYDAENKFAFDARWKLIGKYWRMWELQEFHKEGKSLRSYDEKYELYTFEKTDGIVFKNIYEVDGRKYKGDTYIVFDSENIWKI